MNTSYCNIFTKLIYLDELLHAEGSGELSEKEIFNWLKYDDSRKIFETIVQVPKSAKEIEKLTGYLASKVAEELEIMERHGAIEFAGGKWKATEMGLQVYRKFFT